MNELESLKPIERKRLILFISGSSNKNAQSDLVLNELVLIESENYLNKNGHNYSVKSAKKHQLKKLGKCYANAAQMIYKGYGYVEGYVKYKNSGLKSAHAWNVAKDGSHIDFTFDNADDLEYFGAIIPERDVILTGLKNGGIWYCAIPFLSNDQNKVLKDLQLCRIGNKV